ncbi:HEXXH motif domain-containing protein [Planosporangium sp. 12N6]|uniref:HEXXH motif domain-containing protein n=1 Tax=Planosporangium spinosum TaxID=3402278 RepID=UPI003CF904A4
MRTHTLPGTEFDDLAAGYGSPAGVAALRAAQFSRRLLLLREILRVARSPRLDDAFALLTYAQEGAPRSVAETVTAPQFGAWVAAAYRAARTDGGARHPALGALSAIAVAAAVRAGCEFTFDVPVTGGRVVLPGLGRAAAGDAVVTVVGKAGEYRVGDVTIPPDPAADAPGWTGLRHLRSTVDGCAVTVTLDDLDPYRDEHGLHASDRLGPADVRRWQRLLDDAWPILVRHHRRYAEAIGAGLVTIVPLRPPGSGRSVNGTSMHAFGAVSLSPPRDDLALASSLLHEFQHAKLGALLDLVPLYADDGGHRHYAPWRDDPRPLGGLLQGVYAFLGVTDFWRTERGLLEGAKAHFAHEEFARWRHLVGRALRTLEESDRFTADGRRFLAGMRATLSSFAADTVPADAATIAAATAEDHWVGWRLRNLRPDPDQVRLVRAAWLAGAAQPPRAVDTAVVPGDVRARDDSARLDLALLRLADPARFGGACAQPSELVRVVPAATPGDAAYVNGDLAAAVAAYRAQIDADPDDRRGWVGLALAAGRLGGPDAVVWRTGPELPYAVHRAVRDAGQPAPDPVALARWLARAPGRTGHVGGGSTTQ